MGLLPLLILATPEILVDSRQPLAIWYAAPSPHPTKLSELEITSLLERKLRDETELGSRRVPPASVKHCAGSLACIASSSSTAHALLLVSVVADPEGPDVVTAALVDTRVADRCHREQPEIAELCVAESALLHRVPATRLDDRESLAVFLDRLIGLSVAPILNRRGWARGSISLELVREGGQLSIGMRPLGEAPHRVLLTKVAPGDHELTLRFGDVFETKRVHVEGSKTSTLALGDPAWFLASSRIAVLSTGVAMGLLGVALSAWSIAYATSNEDAVACAPSPCGRRRFLALERMISGARDPREGGLLALPLGYSLVIAGAGLAVGSLLGPWDEVPWIQILVAVGAGAVSYGVSAIVDAS